MADEGPPADLGAGFDFDVDGGFPSVGAFFNATLGSVPSESFILLSELHRTEDPLYNGNAESSFNLQLHESGELHQSVDELLGQSDLNLLERAAEKNKGGGKAPTKGLLRRSGELSPLSLSPHSPLPPPQSAIVMPVLVDPQSATLGRSASFGPASLGPAPLGPAPLGPPPLGPAPLGLASLGHSFGPIGPLGAALLDPPPDLPNREGHDPGPAVLLQGYFADRLIDVPTVAVKIKLGGENQEREIMLPKGLFSPLGGRLMLRPVTAQCGHTAEAGQIQLYNNCPICSAANVITLVTCLTIDQDRAEAAQILLQAGFDYTTIIQM